MTRPMLELAAMTAINTTINQRELEGRVKLKIRAFSKFGPFLKTRAGFLKTRATQAYTGFSIFGLFQNSGH